MWIISAMCFNTVALSGFYRPLKKQSEYKLEITTTEDSKSETVALLSTETDKSVDFLKEGFKGIEPNGILPSNGSSGGKHKLMNGIVENTPSVLTQSDVYTYIESKPYTCNGVNEIGKYPVHIPNTENALSLYRCKSIEIKFSPLKVDHKSRLAYSCHDIQQLQVEEGVISRRGKPSFVRPMYRKDIFYSGSIRNIHTNCEEPPSGNPDIRCNGAPHTYEFDDTTDGSAEEIISPFLQELKKSFDFSLLISPTFVLYGISCFLCMFGKLYDASRDISRVLRLVHINIIH